MDALTPRGCENIIEFYSHVLKLKRMKRTGWLRYRVRDPESIASHAYGVIVLSLLLSHLQEKAEGREKVDSEKILKMAVVHDLAEAVCGDMTPYDKEYERKRKIEKESLMVVVSALPEGLKKEITDLASELREAKSPEAKIVLTADKIDMLLTAKDYEKAGLDLAEFFDVPEKEMAGSGAYLAKYLKSLRNSE